MPGLDKSGPMGQGSMTGRGLGMCNDISAQTTEFQAGYGRGLACRRGFGAGRGRGFYFQGFNQNSPVTASQSNGQESLQTQVDEMKQTLKAIQQQIEKLQEDK